MKIPPASVLFPGRGVSIKGVFYTRQINGKLVVSKWPRKQPASPGSAEAENRKLIAKAARYTAYMSSGSQAFAAALAKDSKLLPRDFLMIALFNRIGYVIFKDGRKVFSMAAVTDVSELLDAIGQTPGDLMVRGETWWQALPKGPPGTVLSVNEDGDYEWVTVGGGGSSGGFVGLVGNTDYSGGNTTSLFATKGYVFTPRVDLTLSAVGWFVDQAASADQYRGVVADANPTTGAIGTNIYLTSIRASGSSDSRAVRGPFATPVNLIAGQSYFIGLQNITGSGTTPARISAAGSGFYPVAPIDINIGLLTFALTGLITGSTPSGGTATADQMIWFQVWPEGVTA